MLKIKPECACKLRAYKKIKCVLPNAINLYEPPNLQDLVLLQHLSGDVEGEILRIDDTSNKAQVLGDEVVAVVHDEDAADVQLNVVLRLLVLEQVEGGALGDVQQSLVWRL